MTIRPDRRPRRRWRLLHTSLGGQAAPTMRCPMEKKRRSGTAEFSGLAKCSVRANFRRNWVGDVASNIWHIAFVHIPGFSPRVPFVVELVVPGKVIVLEIVVSILAIVNAIRTAIKIVVIGRS